MVHTLKGQYDEIKGETDVAMLQRLEFIAYWKKAPFLTLQNTRPHVVLSTTNMVVPLLILFILYGWGPKEECNISRVA